jgi:hypothetical protein
VVKRGGRGDEDDEDREFFSAVWRVWMDGRGIDIRVDFKGGLILMRFRINDKNRRSQRIDHMYEVDNGRWIMGGGEGGEVGERWSIIFGLVKIFRVGSESQHSDKGGRLNDFSPSE